MKMRQLASPLLALLALTPLAYGENDEQNNVEFEQLKVLRPLVGTWQISGEDRSNDVRWEYRLSFEWSSMKKMMVGEGELRTAKANEKLPEKEWQPRDRRYLIWNHISHAIEETVVMLDRGEVVVLSLSSNGRNSFAISGKSTARATPGETFNRVVSVTTEEMTVTTTNRKDDAGTSLPDKTVKLTRIK